MTASILAVIIMLSPGNTAPSTPEIPPPLPTYVTNGDGSRMNCTPNYQSCWPDTTGQNPSHGW
jgi:hypothetical protein